LRGLVLFNHARHRRVASLRNRKPPRFQHLPLPDAAKEAAT
jgi:hypothetical protein